MNSNSNVGGGFRSRLNHYLYSGDKKHVFVGLTLITAVFTIPWYFMSRDIICNVQIFSPCSKRQMVGLGPNTSLIKITWKKLIKPGAKDSHPVLLLPNDLHQHSVEEHTFSSNT
ncbi:hypothetical protein GmHk_08G022846 [Glycine max]|nr:hypothetical protein GmHk_08G022846 [Glycine max]